VREQLFARRRSGFASPTSDKVCQARKPDLRSSRRDFPARLALVRVFARADANCVMPPKQTLCQVRTKSNEGLEEKEKNSGGAGVAAYSPSQPAWAAAHVL
jgi:hypothetical protein